MSEFEELISKLLEKVPELSRSVIEERINEKKEKVGAGYLTDQGAIFLVAADLGVSLEQTQNRRSSNKGPLHWSKRSNFRKSCIEYFSYKTVYKKRWFFIFFKDNYGL